jgi:hypothetical protein
MNRYNVDMRRMVARTLIRAPFSLIFWSRRSALPSLPEITAKHTLYWRFTAQLRDRRCPPPLASLPAVGALASWSGRCRHHQHLAAAAGPTLPMSTISHHQQQQQQQQQQHPTTTTPQARVSRVWAAAVGHPLRAVRVAAMAAVYGFMLARAAALYRRYVCGVGLSSLACFGCLPSVML